MKPFITPLTVALLALAVCAGCGSKGPREGNYIRPIMMEGCPRDMGDGLTPDFRSMVAMIAALGAARYEIHQVSPVDFKIFTSFKEIKGYSVGWEAQVYNDGSVSLTLPTTTPMQPNPGLAFAAKQGQLIARHFEKLKCRGAQDLRTRCATAGYSF
jgi:hypothetical protein